MSALTWLSEHYLVQALGWTLLHASWQILIVALLLRFVLAVFDRQSAALRYMSSLAAMLVVFTWSSYTFFTHITKEHTGDVPVMILDSHEVTPDPIVLSSPPERSAHVVPDRMLSILSSRVNPYIPLVVGAWMLGLFLLSLRFAGSYYYSRLLRKRQLIELPEEWHGHLRRLARQLGLTGPIQLYESGLAKQPMTLGFFKPVILLPAGLLTGLSPDQLEAILIHELVHIRRADYLINLGQTLIEILFFYHPAIWWMAGQIRREREHCCDDQVLACAGDPMAYAKALLWLQQSISPTQSTLAMSITGNTSSFTTRIQRLFVPQANSRRDRNLWSSLLLGLVLGMLAFQTPHYELPPGAAASSFPEGYFEEAPEAPESFPEPTEPFFAEEPEANSWTEEETTSGFFSSDPSPQPEEKPISFRITPDMDREDLNALVEHLEGLGIELDISHVRYDVNNNLKKISASLRADGMNGSFSTDKLELIQVTLYPEDKKVQMEINPSSHTWLAPDDRFPTLAPQADFLEATEVPGSTRSLGFGTTAPEAIAIIRPDNSPTVPGRLTYARGISGSKGKVLIRGLASTPSQGRITARGFQRRALLPDNEPSPLFIVDGVSYPGYSGQEVKRLLKDMNPDNIATIDVIKPPSSLLQYGEEAADGAIILNTKSQGKNPLFTAKSSPGIPIKASNKFTLIGEASNSENMSYYVLDGIRVKDINKLDFNLIESVVVISGDEAIEAYGPEASNGVLVLSSRTDLGGIVKEKPDLPYIDPNFSALPEGLSTLKVYPNPFTHHTTIGFTLKEGAPVRISVHSLSGEEIALVVEDWLEEGGHFYEWKPLEVPEGAYQVRVTVDNDMSNHKIYFEQ